MTPSKSAMGWPICRPVAMAEAELADRALVRRGPALHDGDRRADRALGLEEPEHHRRVGEVAEVDLGAHLAEAAVLADDQQGRDSAVVQEGQQLVHVQEQEGLPGIACR
jgi:hypothetical protein